MVEPVGWTMVEGEPDPAPIDVVEPFDLLERFRRDSSEIATSRFVRPKPGSSTGVVRACPDQIRRHRLRRRRAAGLRPSVGQVQVDFELLTGEVAQIRRAIELVLPVVADNAFIAIVVAAEEVPNGLGTALERHAAANRMSCRERRAKAACFVVFEQVEMLYHVVGVPVVDTLIELLRTRQPVRAGA